MRHISPGRQLPALLWGLLLLGVAAGAAPPAQPPQRPATAVVIIPPGHTAGLEVNGRQIRGITRIRSSVRADGGALIVLERPAARDNFRTWIARSRFGRVGSDAVRTNGSIIVYDSQSKPVAQYTFVNGWPSKATGGTDIAVEELVLAADGIVLD